MNSSTLPESSLRQGGHFKERRQIGGAMGIFCKLGNWLGFAFKNESYKLQGDEITCGNTRRPDRHFNVGDVTAWQIQTQKKRRNVLIKLSDGRVFNWFDTEDQLTRILRSIAPLKELPSVCIVRKLAETEIGLRES